MVDLRIVYVIYVQYMYTFYKKNTSYLYPVLFICSKASERRREKRIQRRGKGWGKIISEEETESEIENRERER